MQKLTLPSLALLTAVFAASPAAACAPDAALYFALGLWVLIALSALTGVFFCGRALYRAVNARLTKKTPFVL